ncbi:MAG: hypothetical protein NZ703_03625 [Gemmataceae bacterium]|nr:hypothetical protein [Gemmataceae bacterium]
MKHFTMVAIGYGGIRKVLRQRLFSIVLDGQCSATGVDMLESRGTNPTCEQ